MEKPEHGIERAIRDYDLSGLLTKLNHHVSHFLLSARLGEYRSNHVEAIRIVLDEFSNREINEEFKLKLDELKKEMDKIVISESVDENILENIQTISKTLKK